jgi:hypothetical protein
MATDAEQLVRVQAAIARIENGSQEYSIGEIRKRNPELQQLYDREEKLLRRISRSSHTGPTQTLSEFS